MNDVLKAVGLATLVPVLPRLLEEAQRTQPTYAAFLEQILQVEAAGRAERACERRVRAAHLPAAKTLEAFDFTFQPTVPERLVRELAELTFVQTATNLIFLGPPGVGKTHLASALARKAVVAGYSALFTTLAQLAEGLQGEPGLSWRQRLHRYLQPQVLVIDEVGYRRLSPDQATALFELVTARYEKGAILL